MENSQHQYYRTRVFTGVFFFFFSWFIILTGLYLLPEKYFRNEHRASALTEERKVMNSRFARQKEEINKMNEEVVQSNNRLNELILESREINNRISRWLEAPLSDQAVRDSIDMLYQRQINQIEPSIDSVGAVFSEKTDVLLEKLGINRELEMKMLISASEEEMYLHQNSGILVTGGFLLFSALAGIFYGLWLLGNGYRRWKKSIQNQTDSLLS